MPHTFRLKNNEKPCRHDYLGKEKHPIDKKSILQDFKNMAGKIEGLPDRLVVRAANIDGKKNIYLRPDTVSMPSLKLKNRNEVAENRLAIKKILGQYVSAFEKSRGDMKLLKTEREALNELQALASGDKEDITLGDIKEPLRILTDSPRNKRADLIRQHYSPRRTDSQEIKTQLNRFLRLSEQEKEILQEMLFPASEHIPLVKQERIVQAMRSLITYKLKHKDLSDDRILKKLDNQDEIRQFVRAWMSLRDAEKLQGKKSLQKTALFPWAAMMDQFCAKLNREVLNGKNDGSNARTAPDGTESEKTLPDVTQKSGKVRPATPAKTQTAPVRKISSGLTPAHAAHSPKLRARKSPLSPLQFAKTIGSSSPITLLNAIGKIPRTESGELEAQIVFYTRASAAAKEMADLTRMRLDAIYRARDSKSVPEKPVSSPGGVLSERFSVRNFGEVNEAISFASVTPPQFSDLFVVPKSQSGLPSAETVQNTTVNSTAMPLSPAYSTVTYPSIPGTGALQSALSDSSLVEDSRNDEPAIRPAITGDRQPAV